MFLLHWLEKEGAPWLDTAENAAQYWEREQNVYMKERSFPKIRNLLKEGISTEWDLTALCKILLDSTVHPLVADDRSDVKVIQDIRNEVSHFRFSNGVEMIKTAIESKLDQCCAAFQRLIDKYAPELKPIFLRAQSYHRAQKIPVDGLSDLISTYLNEVCRYWSSSDCLDSKQFLLPRLIFEPRYAVPDESFSRKARKISESTASMDSMSIDSESEATISQNDWSSGEDSDSEKTCCAYVHCSRDLSECSVCMQMLDAVILKCAISEDKSFKLIRKLRESKRSDSELRDLVNYLFDEEIMEFPVQRDTELTPVLQVLKTMFERGLDTDPKKKAAILALKAMTSCIFCEESFSVILEKAAKDGFFSVERAISTLSFVAMLKMSILNAKILYDVLSTSQRDREFLHDNFGFERLILEIDGAPTLSIDFRRKVVASSSRGVGNVGTVRRIDEDGAHSDHESVAESMLSEAFTKTVQSVASNEDQSDPFGLHNVRFPTYADALKTIWNVLGREIVNSDEIYHIFASYKIQIGGSKCNLNIFSPLLMVVLRR